MRGVQTLRFGAMLLFSAMPLLAVAADDLPTPAPKLVPHASIDQVAPADNSLGLSAHEPEVCEEPCLFGPLLSRASGNVWFRTDYVYYWTQGMRIPPLVTTGPQNVSLDSDTDPAGSLDRLDTTTLWGDGNVLTEGRSGFHINTGLWLDGCHSWAVEFDWLDLGPQSSTFQVSSDAGGSPIYTRPYYDVQAGREWRQLVSYPGTLRGSVSVDAGDYFNTLGVSLRKTCFSSCGCANSCPADGACPNLCGHGHRLDLLFGYRYYGLNDHLTVREDLTGIIAPLTGTRFQVMDSFRAANQFHGAEIGFVTSVDRGPLTLSLGLKAALGSTRHTANIDGQTIITDSLGNSIVYPSGVFAVHNPLTHQGNINTYHRDSFTVIPQIDLEVAYAINCHWRASFGYNLIYWACVQRSGSLYDLNVDPRNIAGDYEATATHFPQYEHCGSSFWAQGLRAGLEYRF